MNRNQLMALLAAASLLTACGSSSDPAPTTQAVSIDFKALVGTETFDCAHTAGYVVGTGTIPFVPQDLRFYVSNVRLVDANGAEAKVTFDASVWQNPTYDVALLDFENGQGRCLVGTVETNKVVTGTVAAGTYVGLRFNLGVPVAANHLNVQSASTPLDKAALYWAWTSGYKFTKIEGQVNRPGVTPVPVFNFHLGSTGCTLGTPGDYSTAVCTTLNYPLVSFASFNASTQAVALDLATLFAGNNMDNPDGGGAAGCMSGATDPECPPIFSSLGILDGSTQVAFKVVAK